MVTTALALIVAGSSSWAQKVPAPPDSGVPPVIAPTAKPSEASPKPDSIYATEITVDVSGVTVIDRNGRRRHLAGGPVQIEIPESLTELPEPPDLDVFGNKDLQREDLVRLTSDVTVEEDEVIRGDVVCVFGGRADVKGEVTGSVISVFGSVNVDGKVGRDVVAPFGQVHIGPTGSVRHNVVASDILKEPGGRVGGTREEVPLNIFGRRWGTPRPVFGRVGEGWGTPEIVSPATTLTVLVVLNILFWMFLVLLAHALAARNVVKVKEKIHRSFFKSFFIGLLAEILVLPVSLLMLVTIIGIPVAIFLVPLMIAAAIVLAQAAMGLLVGEKIEQNTGLVLRAGLTRTLTGFLALQSVSLVAVGAMWAAGNQIGAGPLRLIAIGLFALTILLAYVVMTVGAGAVVMTRFGTRPKDAIPAPVPEPTRPDTDPPSGRTPTPLPQPGSGASPAA
jgi:hypothetical protein